MSQTLRIKAAQHETSVLEPIPSFYLCEDYINGFCRRAECCTKSHEICVVAVDGGQVPPIQNVPNYLSQFPRNSLRTTHLIVDDGPGQLSKQGPRHDNDHISVKDIRILPTTDEILCTRIPYMPRSDTFAPHHLPCGQDKLLDVQFRLLRYDSTEAIIDACYHASQQLSKSVHEEPKIDYDDRLITPCGTHYSLFEDVTFEDMSFNDQKGVCFRMSFACPRALRGRRMGPSAHLEEGMLVALIGLDRDNALSITFLEIYRRQSTDSMKPRTGTDLRGGCSLSFEGTTLNILASVVLSLAETTDIDSMRHLLYRKTGLQKAKFVLVEFPRVLYAGFVWTLRHLQSQYGSNEKIAFLSTIAPPFAGTRPTVSPPLYTLKQGFSFQLNTLCAKGTFESGDMLAFKPQEMVADTKLQSHYVDSLCKSTTLDHGQAMALCEILCRELAFTQGPPGCGKT